MERPFDSVTIRGDRGAHSLTTEEFLGLPLHERVQHILSRNVDFFDGRKLVELRAALAWLRSASAK